MARRYGWRDYQICDHRTPAQQRADTLGVYYQMAAEKLARRGCSPLRWVIVQCKARRIWGDGARRCDWMVALPNAAYENVHLPEVLRTEQERFALRQLGWHPQFKGFLCEFCRYHGEERWTDEQAIRTAETALGTLAAVGEQM